MLRHPRCSLPSLRPESPIALLTSSLTAALILCAMLGAGPARASVHLNEITKIMVGFNGDATIQAVEIKMLSSGQNVVGGSTINVYDTNGAFVATLGTFPPPSLPGSAAGRKILCATANFAATFGITPDLIISPGIPVTTGQVSFESGGCLINAIPYGAISVYKNGPTAAPPLPSGGATALVRIVDNSTTFFCPPQEDANLKFRLASGSSDDPPGTPPGGPITFTNNANASVNVFTTVTAANGDLRGLGRARIYPNPIRSHATIEHPGVPLSFVAVYDVNGRTVRVWGAPGLRAAVGGPSRITWDGTDDRGRRLPSGIYFIHTGTAELPVPVVLLR